MAHTGIFATSDEIIVKAGENVSATGATEARINDLCKQAESYLNLVSRYNWSDNFATLNEDVKGILAEAESNLVAIYLISFDISRYNTRVEAEDMLTILNSRLKECVRLLEDQKTALFAKEA